MSKHTIKRDGKAITVTIPPRTCEECGEYETECICPRLQTRTYTLHGTRLREFESVCAAHRRDPSEMLNRILNAWLSDGARD